jgi:uncharacterized protein
MSLVFEWDNKKAKANTLKHLVSFEEAITVFGDVRSITIESKANSFVEKRMITMGISKAKRILVVVHTERGERIRIISARPASRKERKQY